MFRAIFPFGLSKYLRGPGLANLKDPLTLVWQDFPNFLFEPEIIGCFDGFDQNRLSRSLRNNSQKVLASVGMTVDDAAQSMNRHRAQKHLDIPRSFAALVWLYFRQWLQCGVCQEVGSGLVRNIAEQVKEVPAKWGITRTALPEQVNQSLDNVFAVAEQLGHAPVRKFALLARSVQVTDTLTNQPRRR